MRVKMFFMVCVFLAGVYAVSSDPLSQRRKDSADADVSLVRESRQAAEFQPVGCFSLKELQKKKVIGKKKFKTMKAASSATPIQTCIQEAEKKKIKLFGIQQIKKNIFCRAGDDEKWSDGFNSAHDCSNDIGSKKSVFIYRKSQNSGSSERCTERGRSYGEGEEADVFEKEDEFNSFCKSCTCLGGKFSKCESKYMCDGALGGCEELIHPPEQCCPICKQQSCGQGRAVGDTWQKKEGQNCFHCSCEVGKKERCDPLYCIKLSCKKTVIPEGKCCPECDTTPTIPSWITIATTPTEEPFFPNPFPFDEPES